MLFSRPTHQFEKSLRDFLRRIPGIIFGVRGSAPRTPQIPFVIRLGAAGPLCLSETDESLSRAVHSILSALQKYADDTANPQFHQRMFSGYPLPQAQLRLFCQLAAGFDQMTAATAIALPLRYKLHIVLPGSRDAFRHDLQRNSFNTKTGVLDQAPDLIGFDAAPDGLISKFECLLSAADRVLELDRDDESTDESPFTLNDYAQAGSIILDHSDVVLVAVHEEPNPALGGSRWIEQRAEEKDITIIRIPVERPFDAIVVWTAGGRREHRRLFEAGSQQTDPHIFAAALNDRLLGPAFDSSKIKLGRLERRMIAQLNLEANVSEWNRRWLPDELTKHDLGLTPRQIDDDLKLAKVWADHRASAMAELVRGSFIIGGLLGIIAVFGALVGIIFPALSDSGKGLEIFCLLGIFWLIGRSRRYDWRSQWLSLRQLERYIEQAAWLLLLGRGRIYGIPSHLAQFQVDDVALWTNTYFRAVIRSCSFPTARFTSDYLKTVHTLVLCNLVIDQISYFEGEARFQHKSDEILERWIRISVLTAASATGAYLLADLLTTQHLPGNVVAVLGALLTTAAAALAAMRNHGEYAQLAARFEGAQDALRAIQGQLAARLPNRRPDFSPPPPRSASLAVLVGAATDILIQEVQGWRAILQKKEIEPT